MPTIADLIAEKQRTQKRIADVIGQLEAALSAMRLWSKEEGGDGRPPKQILDMAEVVLKEAKTPLHVKSLAERIEEKFERQVRPASLGTMLYREAVEKKRRFTKDRGENNTYGLKEWEQ